MLLLFDAASADDDDWDLNRKNEIKSFKKNKAFLAIIYSARHRHLDQNPGPDTQDLHRL